MLTGGNIMSRGTMQRGFNMLISKSENGGALYRTASGHLSCENDKLLPEDQDRVEDMLSPMFGKK